MIFNTSGGTVAFQNIVGNPSDNTALNNELSSMVKHSNSLPGTATPINADQLNGVADTGYVKKYGTSTADWDTIPTAGSTKPVTSGGVASIVTQSITDGDTTHSPSGDAVNGALNAISTTISNIPSDLLSVQQKEVTIASVPANGVGDGSLSVARTGYTAIGLVGWSQSYTGGFDISYAEMSISNQIAYVRIRNFNPASYTDVNNIFLNILYVKNTL